MLQKVCTADKIPLVNIVRKEEHEALLKGIGAEHVVNMSKPTFLDDLMVAIRSPLRSARPSLFRTGVTRSTAQGQRGTELIIVLATRAV